MQTQGIHGANQCNTTEMSGWGLLEGLDSLKEHIAAA